MAKRAFTIDTGKEQIEVEGHVHSQRRGEVPDEEKEELALHEGPGKGGEDVRRATQHVKIIGKQLTKAYKVAWEKKGTGEFVGARFTFDMPRPRPERDVACRNTTEETRKTDDRFKAVIVATILDSKTEKAIELLSEHYHVEQPKLGVGVVKGRSKGVLAVYSANRKEILAVEAGVPLRPLRDAPRVLPPPALLRGPPQGHGEER